MIQSLAPTSYMPMPMPILRMWDGTDDNPVPCAHYMPMPMLRMWDGADDEGSSPLRPLHANANAENVGWD